MRTFFISSEDVHAHKNGAFNTQKYNPFNQNGFETIYREITESRALIVQALNKKYDHFQRKIVLSIFKRIKKMQDMKDKVQEIDNQIRDKLAHYISQLIIFAGIFFLIFIISGIWHAVLSKNLNNDFFKLVAGDSPFAIAVSICVLSFGSIFVIILLCVTLYLFGNIYNLHFTIAAVVVLAVLSNVVLTTVNLGLTANGSRTKYENSIREFLKNNSSEKAVLQWMKDYSCTNSSTCEQYIKSYVTLRCTGECIACGVTLFFSLIAILGISITVILMGRIKRPTTDDQTRNLSEYQTPDDGQLP